MLAEGSVRPRKGCPQSNSSRGEGCCAQDGQANGKVNARTSERLTIRGVLVRLLQHSGASLGPDPSSAVSASTTAQ